LLACGFACVSSSRCSCRPHPLLLLLLQLERVTREQSAEAAARCYAGFYYTESATTRHIILALPKHGEFRPKAPKLFRLPKVWLGVTVYCAAVYSL
jgi:hypothetical protein